MPRPKGAKDADHDEKRSALLARMTVRLMRREPARPSLRQLADAAGVAVPTLRHYFGGRVEVVRAIFEEYRKLGEARLRSLAEHPGPLDESVRQFAHMLIDGMQAARPVNLGDVFAVSLAEGLLDETLGPAALGFILDPAVETLQARLEGHICRGEMVAADTRAAALILLSPLLVAVLHQQEMGGAACNPVDVRRLADELCAAFLRAYATRPQ